MGDTGSSSSEPGKVTVYCRACERAVLARLMGEYYVMDCGHSKWIHDRD